MKNLSIFALSLLLILSACKKDDPTVIVDPADKKLTRITYENNKFPPETIEYDAKGRVSRYLGSEDHITFTYNGDEIIITEWRVAENREVFHFKGTLNAAGNITKGSGVSSYIAGDNKAVNYTFEYNADGKMTRKTQNYNNGASIYVYDYTYNNQGDLTELKVYLNGTYEYGGTWEYDNSKLEKSGLNWNHFYGPNTCTGPGNKHMAIKYTGNTGWFVNMTYKYDNQGYPISNNLVYDDGDTWKMFYTFE